MEKMPSRQDLTEFQPSKRKNMREKLRNSIAAFGALLWVHGGTNAIAQNLDANPDLKSKVENLSRDLAPGGEWFSKINAPTLKRADLNTLIERQAPIANTLRYVWEKEKKDNENILGMYKMSSQIPGLTMQRFAEYEVLNGEKQRKETVECSGQYVRYGSEKNVYLMLAAHCIEHEDESVRNEYSFYPEWDVAVKLVTNYTGKTLTVSPTATRAMVSGEIGCIVGTKKGELQMHCGTLAPITASTLSTLNVDIKGQQHLLGTLRNGLWTVVSDEAGVSHGKQLAPLQGLSGGVVLAYDPHTKSWAVAGILSSFILYASADDQGISRKRTVAFLAGPETLARIIEKERSKHQLQQQPRKSPRFGEQVIVPDISLNSISPAPVENIQLKPTITPKAPAKPKPLAKNDSGWKTQVFKNQNR